MQRKRYKGENKRSDCQIKVIERVRRNGPRIAQPVVVFLDKKKEEGKKTRERILNGYLLRSVDCTSERSGFNHEKGKQMLFYVTLQSRATDRSPIRGDEIEIFLEESLRHSPQGFPS